MSYLALRATDLPFFAIGVVFFFVYLMTRLANRDRELKRRVELVDRALDSGHIDAATKRELLAAVTDRRRNSWHPALVIGWIGLFAGLGMVGLATLYRHWWEPAIMVTAISFGVISVPIGMRELQGRAAETPRSD